MTCRCQIRVTSRQKYCCDINDLTVPSGCIGKVNFSNLPETPILFETTPGNWSPADPESISGSGCITLFKPGKYRFEVDCASIHGTDAPEEDSIGLCYDCERVQDTAELLVAQVADLSTCLEEAKSLLQEISDQDVAVIESSFAQIGCVKEEGVQTGVVMACKKTDVDGNVVAIDYWLLVPGQPPVPNYTGPWEFCTDLSALICEPSEALGVLTTW